MTWIRSFVVMAAVGLITLRLADVVFGALVHEETLTRASHRHVVLREYDPGQALTVRPDAVYLRRTDSLEDKPYSIELDQNGFIKTGNPEQLDAELKILFLGGSTTEALYVTETVRFTSVVERLLRERLNRSVSVLNAGVSGNHSLHSLVQLIAKGLPQQPQIVVLMHNINDLALLTKTGSYWTAPPTREIVSSRTAQEFSLRALVRQVRDLIAPNLYRYLRPRLFPYREVDEFEGYAGQASSIRSESILAQWRASLRTFVATSRSWNVEPVLMTQFNRVQLGDKALADMNFEDEAKTVALYHQFNEVTREVARELATPLIDLARDVPSTSQYLYDLVHLNDEGSELVGELVAKALESKIVGK